MGNSGPVNGAANQRMLLKIINVHRSCSWRMLLKIWSCVAPAMAALLFRQFPVAIHGVQPCCQVATISSMAFPIGVLNTHPFNGPLSGTTRVSQYQKGKTNLDFTEAGDSEWQWLQLGHMQVCTLLQTDTTPAPHRSVFYRPDALPVAQPTASKH